MKKFIGILLTLAIICTFAVIPVTAEIKEVDGYYEIYTADDYVAFVTIANKNLSANARLMADIDLTGKEVVPIGTDNTTSGLRKSYTGTFDGQGYALKNVSISGTYSTTKNSNNETIDAKGFGVFAHVSGTVKNLGLIDSSISVNTKNSGGRIGGLVCFVNNGAVIENCYVKNITVTQTGKIDIKPTAIGVFAYFVGATAQIRNCYVNGGTINVDAEVSYSVSRFAGYVNNAGNGDEILNCYTKGVTIVNNSNTANISNFSHIDGKTSAITANTNCYTDSEAGKTSTYPAVITNDWSTLATSLGSAFKADTDNKNGGAPRLVCEKDATAPAATPTPIPVPAEHYDGAGTEEDPFLIKNLADLNTLSKDVNDGYTFKGRYFKLTSDIDMYSKDNTEENAWTPIGSTKTLSFSGVFDGNGKVIKNVYVTARQSNMGFFGYLNEAEVKNLGIEKIKFEYTNDAEENRVNYVGGFAGTINNSKIDSCYVHDFVNINHKKNTSEGYAGPFAGYAYDAQISNCFIVNMIFDGSENAVCSGFVGNLNGSDTNKTVIKNCYSAGNIVFITNPNSFWKMGRITKNANVKTAEKCYYSYDVLQDKNGSTNVDLGDKGCVELTETQMQNASENLGTAFRNADGGHENYGYPMLSWMSDVPLEYYPVTIEITGKGSCEINSSMLKDGNQVAYNALILLDITPAIGYAFKSLNMNGYLINYDYIPSFKMGRAPVLLTVEFEKIEKPNVAPNYTYKHEGTSTADALDAEHFAPASGLTNGVFAIVPEKGDKTNNVIKVVPSAGSNNYFNYYPEGGLKYPYSEFTLEYDVYVENIKNSSYVGADASDVSDNVVHKLETALSDGEHLASFSFLQNENNELSAKFEDSDSEEVIKLKEDNWYSVVMTIDPQSGKHDVSVIDRLTGTSCGRLIYTSSKTAGDNKGVGISFHAGYCSSEMPEADRNCYYLDNLKYTTNKFYMPGGNAEVVKSGNSVKFNLPTYLNVPSASTTRTPVMIAGVFDKNGKLLVGADLDKAVLNAQDRNTIGSSNAQHKNLSGNINVSSLADGKYDVKVVVWFDLFGINAQIPYFEALEDSITVSNGSIVSE